MHYVLQIYRNVCTKKRKITIKNYNYVNYFIIIKLFCSYMNHKKTVIICYVLQIYQNVCMK